MTERIDGHTLLISLMATPIRHSLSPTMHNEAFAKLGLDYAYMAFEVGNEELPQAVAGIRALGIRGSNVSMPNKQKILHLLDELSPAAALVGAVNTVTNKDGKGHLVGYNFVGILFSPNVALAMVFGVIAGIANSCLDSGTYLALMESFPKTAGTANVLIKAAVQIGQFVLPFIIAFLGSSGLWFGWSFIVCLMILGLNGLFLLKLPFPDADQKAAVQSEATVSAPVTKFKSQPKIAVEGVAFVIYGFISQATFYLISQYIALYGQEVAAMSENSAKLLVSYYSTGSLICVGVTAVMAAKIRPVNLLLPYTFASFVAIGAMWLVPTPTVLTIGSVLVGFFAAGGVLQLGLTVMGEMFPAGKGTITGIFYTFGSIASFVIPVVSGKIASSNPHAIMLFDTVISGIGFALEIIIFICYRQTVDTSN